ncbi:MAG: C45 family autoproteolytic acyltransferase/hydrolase [Candidatus Thorarchaeota archaeon]
MKEIRIKGNYLQMGRTFGKTLSQFHREFSPKVEHLEFGEKCETAVKKYAPDLLDEIKGIAEATKKEYESLVVSMLSPWFIFGCTLFAVKGEFTQNGNPVFARHMDWLKQDIDALHVIHTEPEDGYKSVGFSFGDCGRYGGQNEHGLTIASAAIAGYNGRIKPGVRMNVSTRWALDKLTNTEEAVKYLTRIPHTEAMAFLINDRSGTIARVEAAPEKTDFEFIDEGIGIATNVFVMDSMKDLDQGLPKDNHVYKYIDRLESWFDANQGRINLDDVISICSDEKEGICQADEAFMEVTIWSWIAETNPCSMQLAPGPPCKTDYRYIDKE